jgi:hypothetical protein
MPDETCTICNGTEEAPLPEGMEFWCNATENGQPKAGCDEGIAGSSFCYKECDENASTAPCPCTGPGLGTTDEQWPEAVEVEPENPEELDASVVPEVTVRQQNVIDEGVGQVQGLLHQYWSRIDDAFNEMGTDEPFKISLAITLKGADPVKVKTDISFTESKVKDHVEADIYVTQSKMEF